MRTVCKITVVEVIGTEVLQWWSTEKFAQIAIDGVLGRRSVFGRWPTVNWSVPMYIWYIIGDVHREWHAIKGITKSSSDVIAG